MEGGVAALFRSGCRIGCAFLSIAGCRGEDCTSLLRPTPHLFTSLNLCANSHLSTSAPFHTASSLHRSIIPSIHTSQPLHRSTLPHTSSSSLHRSGAWSVSCRTPKTCRRSACAGRRGGLMC